MKSFLIALCCVGLMACSSSDEEPAPPQTEVNDYTPGYSGGGSYYNPCGRVYILEIKTDAGTFRKEVPIYCNPYGEEPYGDPPDYQTYVFDPRPYEKQIVPQPDQQEMKP